MNIIYMLLTISLFVALVFFVLFVFSMRKGQYDDTYTPAVRMLFEDELVKESPKVKKEDSEAETADKKRKLTNPDK